MENSKSKVFITSQMVLTTQRGEEVHCTALLQAQWGHLPSDSPEWAP